MFCSERLDRWWFTRRKLRTHFDQLYHDLSKQRPFAVLLFWLHRDNNVDDPSGVDDLHLLHLGIVTCFGAALGAEGLWEKIESRSC